MCNRPLLIRGLCCPTDPCLPQPIHVCLNLMTNVHWGCPISSPVDDFEWIEPPPIDQLGGGAVEGERRSRKEAGKLSPRTRIRERWKSAIQQQILLNRMDKENQLFQSELKMWHCNVWASDPKKSPSHPSLCNLTQGPGDNNDSIKYISCSIPSFHICMLLYTLLAYCRGCNTGRCEASQAVLHRP